MSCEYLREFSKKLETALMVYSEAWGKLIQEKNQKQKISRHYPFKRLLGYVGSLLDSGVLLASVMLLASLLALSSLLLMLFPQILASLLLFVSSDVPVVSCAAVGPAVAVILTAFVSSWCPCCD